MSELTPQERAEYEEHRAKQSAERRYAPSDPAYYAHAFGVLAARLESAYQEVEDLRDELARRERAA